MIEYEWEYTLYCDECGGKRRFFRQDMYSVFDEAESHGWLLGNGMHLCPRCRREYEMPCRKCQDYVEQTGICMNPDSPHYENCVLPTMHCSWWIKKGGGNRTEKKQVG